MGINSMWSLLTQRAVWLAMAGALPAAGALALGRGWNYGNILETNPPPATNLTESNQTDYGDPASNCAFGTFKQCDSRWGSNKLGTSTNTICRAGCPMSCVSMILAGRA